MDLELHAAALLCALAAVVFAARTAARPLALGVLAAVFASTLLVAAYVPVPAPATTASVVVAAAALAFARPQWHALFPLATGLLAALSAATLSAQGLPLLLATLALVVAVVASIAAARRPSFAPAGLCDEAALIVGALALVLAVGTELIDGWRAGLALTAKPFEGEPLALHASIVALALASLALGGLYTLWKRR